jgi:ribosomal protein L11 methyltransferase
MEASVDVGWRRVRLRVPTWAEDAVTLFLVERGLAGVEILEEAEARWLVAHLPQGGAGEDLERDLQAYLGDLEALHGRPVRMGWEVARAPGVNWGEIWKAHFRCRRVSRRLVVKPSWEDHEAAPGDVVLEIDPGQAFGTGLHATTRLCLAWIDELMGEEGLAGAPHRALDLGTGTGILAIGLAKLGAAEVWALDNDPVALQAARMNVARNGVQSRVRVLEGSLERLDGGTFSLIAANLTADTLAVMSGRLAACLASGGRLLASGILAEQSCALVLALQAAGLRKLAERQEGEWCAQLLTSGD